jgi:hypothetical protein
VRAAIAPTTPTLGPRPHASLVLWGRCPTQPEHTQTGSKKRQVKSQAKKGGLGAFAVRE